MGRERYTSGQLKRKIVTSLKDSLLEVLKMANLAMNVLATMQFFLHNIESEDGSRDTFYNETLQIPDLT